MPVLAVMDAGARITLDNGALLVRRPGGAEVRVRPHEVTELQLHGRVELGADARSFLLRSGIDVVFLSGHGAWMGRLTGADSRAADRRLRQYRLVDSPARVPLARALIAGKIENQRRLLFARQRHLRHEGLAGVLGALRAGATDLERATDLDRVRGYEGIAAKRYFEGLGYAFTHPAFPFDGRNRRPPRDPINACLSFGYALLLSQVERAVRATGLDPWLGVLHEAGRGAPALALDLCEEWRPLVDGLVLTLVNRRQLAPEDFREPGPDDLGPEAEIVDGEDVPAVWLGPLARSVMIRAFEHRLDERGQHPIRGDDWAWRLLIVEQAAQLARIVDGSTDPWLPVRIGGSLP